MAKSEGDFHGVLLTCGSHPTVLVLGTIVYAYEPDLTHYLEGKAERRADSVTLSFPSRYRTFVITRRGARFFADGRRCTADDV